MFHLISLKTKEIRKQDHYYFNHEGNDSTLVSDNRFQLPM